MADLLIPGSAQPSQVLPGVTFSAGANYDAAGTMSTTPGATLSPSTAAQTAIAAGTYASGAITVNPVTGTAAAGDIRSGKTASSASGIGLTGTIPDNGSGPTVNPSTATQSLAAGIYDTAITVAGDANLVASNILSGKTIFGVAGNVSPLHFASGTSTSNASGQASIADTAIGFTPRVIIWWVNGDATNTMGWYSSDAVNTVSGTSYHAMTVTSAGAVNTDAWTNSGGYWTSGLGAFATAGATFNWVAYG